MSGTNRSMNNAHDDGDEEPDYLSDAFLQTLEDSKVRKPSAAASVPQPKNRKIDAEQVLLEGLSKPITEENLGFKLLAKMGYKASDKLDPQAKPPIEIQLKSDRTGIGIAEESRKQARLALDTAMELANERTRQEADTKQQYLKSKGSKFEARRLLGHLIKIRKVEENLCQQLGLELPPVAVDADPAEIDITGDFSDSPPAGLGDVQDTIASSSKEAEPEKMHLGNIGDLVGPDYVSMLANHVLKLRSTPFFYCYYCGTRYEDEEDLAAHCPGETEEAHE